VYGYRLQPLSAFHVAALMLVDSPFIAETERDAGIQDVAFAVFVCCLTYPDGAALLFPEPQFTPIDLEKYSTEDEMETLRQYFLDYLDFPDLFEDEGSNSKQTGLPWPFFTVATVLQHMRGIKENTAWNMGINLLVCYRTAIAETHGWEVVSQMQHDIDKMGRELKAALDAMD